MVIMGCHTMLRTHGYNPQLWKSLYGYGHLSIQLFFCCSGFLVYAAFAQKSPNETKPISNFFIRRTLRIIPLWWACLFFVYFYYDFPFHVLVANMFFYFGFVMYNHEYVPIVAAWSLFVEETFYLTFPWLYKFYSKTKILPYLILSIFVAIFWVKFAGTWGIPKANYFILRSPVGNFRFFLTGIGIYHLYRSDYWPTISEAIKPWMNLFLIVLFILVYLNSPYSLELVVFLFVCSALIPGTLIHRVMDQSVFHWVGVRCYAFYLVHTKLVIILDTHLLDTYASYVALTSGPRFWALYALSTVFTALVAGISYRWFEKPLILLGEKIIQKRENTQRV